MKTLWKVPSQRFSPLPCLWWISLHTLIIWPKVHPKREREGEENMHLSLCSCWGMLRKILGPPLKGFFQCVIFKKFELFGLKKKRWMSQVTLWRDGRAKCAEKIQACCGGRGCSQSHFQICDDDFGFTHDSVLWCSIPKYYPQNFLCSGENLIFLVGIRGPPNCWFATVSLHTKLWEQVFRPRAAWIPHQPAFCQGFPPQLMARRRLMISVCGAHAAEKQFECQGTHLTR